jgi:hypothetical protein
VNEVAPQAPRLPIEYSTAIKALAACMTLNEAKYWDDKADALAAWSKIYRSNDAEQKALCLKLHAYRRMGEIAEELRPSRVGRPAGDSPGTSSALLASHGLSKPAVRAARKLAALPKQAFEKILEKPQAPTTVAGHLTSKDPLWREFCQYAMGLRGFSRRINASAVAAACRDNERCRATAERLLHDLREFLNDLERGLAK